MRVVTTVASKVERKAVLWVQLTVVSMVDKKEI